MAYLCTNVYKVTIRGFKAKFVKNQIIILGQPRHSPNLGFVTKSYTKVHKYFVNFVKIGFYVSMS